METEPTPTLVESPSQAGSKLLSRYSDAEGLLLRSTVEAVPPGKAPSIPLQRFQELEQAIKHSPANEAPYIELGRIYLEQKRWGDAKRVLDAGVQFCAECEPLLLMREDLTLHLATQHVDEAKTRCAQKPTEQNRYDLEQAEINLANERIRICSHRFARRPEDKDILIPWAIALRQLGRHDESVELLAKAAEVPSLRARASLQLGMCLQYLNRPLEALSALRKAALFRSPPPDPALRLRALELAASIAEENQLIDAAIFYTEQWLSVIDVKRRSEVESRLASLRTKPL